MSTIRTMVVTAVTIAASFGGGVQGAVARPLTCKAAATHIVDIALQGFDAQLRDAAVAARRGAEIRHLEQQCLDERWSRNDLACLVDGKEMIQLRRCRPETRSADLAPLPGDDVSCTAVGVHVTALVVANMTGLAEDNVAATVLTDPAELRRDVTSACRTEHWSEPLRRCDAGATRFAGTLSCRREARGASRR